MDRTEQPVAVTSGPGGRCTWVGGTGTHDSTGRAGPGGKSPRRSGSVTESVAPHAPPPRRPMSAEALLAALAAIHDPTTPAPLRLQATAQCEAFKAAGIASMPVALQLCRRSSPQAGRHFGLQTIIHVVEQCWNNLSPDDKQIMCQTAVQLCQEDDTGSRFVCEMQARIIVEIACRQWPQEWPRLHEILLDLAARSQHNAIVTCSVFTGLAELVVKPTQPGRVFLPERRRLEIRQGLEACLPAVNAALGGMLQVGSREVALAAITCIAATAEWESHANLVASQILSRLSALMTSRTDLFEFAVEPLLKICSRRPPSLTDDLVAELIAVWRATVLVTSTILRSAPFPDQQRLLKIAVELLAALSRHQMQPLLDTNDVSLHHMYLALLGDLLKYPDDADVGITTLSIWLPVIKSGKLVSAEQRPALLTELLQISADRVIAGAPSTGTTDEQSRNAQRYRTSLLDMVRVVAGEAPTAAIQVAGGHCLCLLSVRGSDVAQAQSAQMMLQTVLETPAIRQILAGEAPDKDGVEALAYSLLVSLLQLHCEDTQLLIRYCSALSHFHELLGRRPDVLRLAIDKLLTINDLGSADVPDELAYQRKAICVLIGLAKRARPCAVMVQWFPTLSPAVMALCSQRPRHAAQLIEFLVAIANSLADPQQRVAYVSALIEPDLVAFQTIVSDMTSSRFMSLFGLGRVDGKVAFNIAQAKALRPQLRQILGLLASFLSILRTASVDERIWTSLLPGIVTLTTRLHELYCVRPDDMAPSANAILEVSHGDAHIQIRKMVGDQRSDVEADVDVSRAQFGSLRDRLYGLLAVVMQVRPVAVVACLPQSLSAFSIWRLQPILQKVLTPFLESHCPVEDDIFVRVFAQVVREMLNVLRVAWNRAAVPQERVSVERDVFEDNALRDLTRAVLSLIMSTVATSGWVPFAEANPAAGPSRADAALDRVASSPPILQDLFAITSLAIQCPDSHAQRSASIITCRLIPATVACGCQQMVVEMCSLVLRSLSCDVTGHPDHISVVQVALHQLALDRSSNVADLLRTIPGAVPQEVDRLVDELKGAPQSTKVLRSAVRAFLLAYVIGKQCDRANGAKIVDLDAPLVFAAKPSPTIADDDTPIVALHDLLESQT